MIRTPAITLLSGSQPPSQSLLAAREVRRYVYASTGVLVPLSLRGCEAAQVADVPGAVVLLTAACARLLGEADVRPVARALERAAGLDGEAHLIHRLSGGAVAVGGGDAIGLLYGAYHFAELVLGVHFGVGGEIVRPVRWDEYHAGASTLGDSGVLRQPQFAVRGINPFHDFAEGPDFWDAANYKAYTSNMAKMRMNLLALHNYANYKSLSNRKGGYDPSYPLYTEPAVWLGPASDVDAAGHVHSSYANGTQPVTWHSTCISQDGVPPTPVDRFVSGAGLLFSAPCVPERWQPIGPKTDTLPAHEAAFDFAAELFKEVRVRDRGRSKVRC